jgi:hypothetical protein
VVRCDILHDGMERGFRFWGSWWLLGGFQVMQKLFLDLFEAQPDLLFQLMTMLNLTVLWDSSVLVCTTT